MNNLPLYIAQSEEDYGTSSSSAKEKRFITNPQDLIDLDEEQMRSYFRNPEEESRIERGDEIADETVNLGEFRAPIIQFSTSSPRRNYSVALQKWQGYVVRLLDGAILVRLHDLTQKGPDEETEIPLAEISEGDMGLIKPGAIFYWSIGYLKRYSGQLTRFSDIRFQRLPVWTQGELDEAKREARRLKDIIGWE